MRDTVITQPPQLMVIIDFLNSNPPSSACVCDGYLTATAAGGTPSYSFLWSTGATSSLVTGLCSDTPYSIVLTDSKGCTDTDTVVFAPPQLSVSVSYTAATCYNCSDGSASANPMGGNTPYSYIWSNGQSTQTATGLAPGNYTVCVTDANGCSVCDSVYVGFSVGINESTANSISIFPNPSTGIFLVSGISTTEIEILNVLGEKITQGALFKKSGNMIVDLSNYPDGIYFLRIKCKQNLMTKKIILSR